MNEMFSQGGKGSTGILTNKQAIARKFGVKQNEVVYFAVGVDLGGYKVIYDKTTQRAYSLPVLPVGTTAVSLSVQAVLVHSAGTVDLGELAATRKEFVSLSDTFTTGLVVNTRNELLFHNNIGYTYLGALPVTIAEGTNPVGNADWKPQSDPYLRDDLANTGEVQLGDALIGVKSALVGAYPRTQHGKNGDYVSLYDFGATGDGSLHPLSERYSTLEEAQEVYPFATSLSHSLDWAAMQAAANSKKITIYTKGHYVVNNTVTLYNSTRIQGEGNADNINRAQTFIQVVGNIPLFLNDQTTSPIPTPIQVHIDGLYIYYDNQGTPPNAPEHYGKVAFKIQPPVSGTTGLEMSCISNCTVHGAYTAISDQSGTYLTRWTNVWARDCHNGFLKGHGTTLHLDTCYTMGCVSPYQFGSVYSVTMVNCAMDQSSITLAGGSLGGAGVHFINSHSVNIMGFDAEGNIISTDGAGDAALFHFENTNGKISGLTGHLNQLRTLAPAATGNVSFIKASGTSHVIIDSSEDDESSSAIVYTGSGYPMTIYSKDTTSRIDIYSGRWREPAGGSPVVTVVSNGNVGWFCKPLSGLITGGGYSQETSGDGLKTLAFYTNKGVKTVSAGTSTPLFSLPNTEGVYLISTWGSGSDTNYASVHVATYEGSVVTLTPLKNNPTYTTFTASGLTVSMGIAETKTIKWTYTKIG